MDTGLLILRLAVGLTLVGHGSQKLFGWFGGYGLEGTGGFLEQLGFRPGRRAALMAGLTEAGGGALLTLGLLTPLAATMSIAVMLVAIVSVHLSKGFFASNGGYEYPLLLAVAALTLAITGPGQISLDALLGTERAGLPWGIAAAALGSLGAAVQLLGRRITQASPASNAA
jgi:putative oxidoreductase